MNNDSTKSSADTIDAILAVEWRMFSAVKSASPASCQSRPLEFKKIRGSIFSYWPYALLRSYLDDLQTAERQGRNLLTEKYARMDQLIPIPRTNPLIEAIVAVETRWQQEIRSRYPALFNQVCRKSTAADDGSNFSVYMRSELETYSDTTLALYHEWVQEADRQGRNISLSMLAQLVAESSFKSIDEAERYFSGS